MDWISSNPYGYGHPPISPTIVLEDNEVRLETGAPGGGRIPAAVLQNILYIPGHDLDPIDAMKMPRIFPEAGIQTIGKGFNSQFLHEVPTMGYDL